MYSISPKSSVPINKYTTSHREKDGTKHGPAWQEITFLQGNGDGFVEREEEEGGDEL